MLLVIIKNESNAHKRPKYAVPTRTKSRGRDSRHDTTAASTHNLNNIHEPSQHIVHAEAEQLLSNLVNYEKRIRVEKQHIVIALILQQQKRNRQSDINL